MAEKKSKRVKLPGDLGWIKQAPDGTQSGVYFARPTLFPLQKDNGVHIVRVRVVAQTELRKLVERAELLREILVAERGETAVAKWLAELEKRDETTYQKRTDR